MAKPQKVEKWYLKSPLKLGSIFDHYIDKEQISFGVNVLGPGGHLICTTEILMSEMEHVDREKMKKYLVGVIR